MSADGFEMSKSAKKRAAKKARDEAHDESNTPAAPAPAPAKGAAAAPKATAKAALDNSKDVKCTNCGATITAGSNFCNMCGTKRSAAGAAPAKAEPKAAEKAAPAAAKAEAKTSAKAAAKKSKAEPTPPPPQKQDGLTNSFEDDGTGGEWEQASGNTKKKDKQQAKKQAEETTKAAPKSSQAAAKSSPASAAAAPKAKAGGKAQAAPTTALSIVEKIQMDAEKKAIEKAAQKRAEEAAKAEGGDAAAAALANFTTATIPCPAEKVGRIVGPKGATLEMLREKTGVHRIDTKDGMVTLIGEPDSVKKCEVAVREMVEKGYMSIQYDNFGEQNVMVHPTIFPDLIGPKGSIVQKIKKELGVEINIPQGVTKDASGKWGKRKYAVQIAGSSDKVEKAKEVINDIVQFQHHPITHPDVSHKEMEIEDWTYRYIIGPKGAEMRHIQNSFKVKVNIPREGNADTGACPNLLIVGSPENVDKAKNYIEKLIVNAEKDKGGRKEDEAMGDERDKNDEVDAQAAQYMVKR